MANRKGVISVNKWATSDGEEFPSANQANDWQGAVNELDRDFETFEKWLYGKDRTNTVIGRKVLDPEIDVPRSLRQILFAWEHHKNAVSARTAELFPENESGVSEPDTEGGTGTDQTAGTDQTENTDDQKPSIAMENPDPLSDEDSQKPKSADKKNDKAAKDSIKNDLKL